MRNRNVFSILISLIILFASLSIRAAEKVPLVYNSNLFREELIEINAESIKNWLRTERESQTLGRVNLTITENVLVGAITIDNESYRLRSTGGGLYSLVEINQRNLPKFDDVVTYSDDKSP